MNFTIPWSKRMDERSTKDTSDILLRKLRLLCSDGDHREMLALLQRPEANGLSTFVEENGRSIMHHICIVYNCTRHVSSMTRNPPIGYEKNYKTVTAIDVVSYLIRNGANVNLKDEWGCSPIMAGIQSAVFHCRPLNLIKHLTELGAEVNLADIEGETMVMKTATCANWVCGRKKGRYMSEEEMRTHKSHVEALRFLVSTQADVNGKDSHHLSALMMVALLRDPVLTEDPAHILLSVPDIDVNLTNSRNQSALHLALTKRNFHLGHQILHNRNCNVNMQDEDGYTPLYMAVWSLPSDGPTFPTVTDRIDITIKLLELGADPNIPDSNGVFPIEKAVNNVCSKDLITILINHGVNVGQKIALHTGPCSHVLISPIELFVIEGKYDLVNYYFLAGATIDGIQFSDSCSGRPDLQKKFIDRLLMLKRKFGVMRLQYLCRVTIRQVIRPPNLHSKIEELALPFKLKMFLKEIKTCGVEELYAYNVNMIS